MILNLLKSIGAVLAGFITVAVLSILTDTILETLGVFPPMTRPEAYVTWMLVVALLYRSIYTVAGGYVTAKLARNKPMCHVWWLMGIGGASGTVGAIAAWGLGNHWYPVLIAVTGPICIWVGGKLFMRGRKLS